MKPAAMAADVDELYPGELVAAIKWWHETLPEPADDFMTEAAILDAYRSRPVQSPS